VPSQGSDHVSDRLGGFVMRQFGIEIRVIGDKSRICVANPFICCSKHDPELVNTLTK
jgi:hypothetical protein